MKVKVGIVDYGMGNLHSVAKAVALQGGSVSVTDSKNRLKGSDLLVLPGVGAFGAAMTTLAQKKLDDFIWQWIEEGKPYLGICLGFQLLFERSEESPRVKGLGVFKGDVVRFNSADFKKKGLQIPHMGWNNANRKAGTPSDYFKGVDAGNYFYFVHSYYPEPKDKSVLYSETLYGKPFCSSVAQGNLFASQFHPEKSGDSGKRLLKNILKKAA